MPATGRRALHPLLMERRYWQNRLQVLRLARPSVLLIPRGDLSTALVEVDEFRIRTHDGMRLNGLRAQSRLAPARGPVRVRSVGPSEVPQVDAASVLEGGTELVFQIPAGRKLEDRVLDVLRVCQLAAGTEVVGADRVTFVSTSQAPDEFLIATHLLAEDVTGKDRFALSDETAPPDLA